MAFCESVIEQAVLVERCAALPKIISGELRSAVAEKIVEGA